MTSEQVQIFDQLRVLTQKWFWSRRDSKLVYKYLRNLADLTDEPSGYANDYQDDHDEAKNGLREIGRLDSVEAVVLLVAIARKMTEPYTFNLVVHTLTQMHHPTAMYGLMELAACGDESLREMAVLQLCNYQHPDAMRVLQAVLTECEPSVYDAAMEAVRARQDASVEIGYMP